MNKYNQLAEGEELDKSEKEIFNSYSGLEYATHEELGPLFYLLGVVKDKFHCIDPVDDEDILSRFPDRKATINEIRDVVLS